MWNMKDYLILGSGSCDIGAHLAGVTAHAWGGEQDACGYVPAFWVAGVHRYAAADGGHAITAGCGQQL